MSYFMGVSFRSCLGIYLKKHFFNPLFSETIYLWSFYYNMRNLHANMSHFVPRDWNGEYIFVNFLIYQTLLCFISHFVQTSKWETFASRSRLRIFSNNHSTFFSSLPYQPFPYLFLLESYLLILYILGILKILLVEIFSNIKSGKKVEVFFCAIVDRISSMTDLFSYALYSSTFWLKQ